MWKIEKIISKGDYNYALVPKHPEATKNGYVLEHRIIMENHLGRLLIPNEVVHHINENKKDNRIENLEVVEKSKHAKFHTSLRGRKWIALKCPLCKIQFEKRRNQLNTSNKYGFFCSKKCAALFQNMVQSQGLTQELESAISENIVREYKKYPLDNSEETI